MPTPVSTARQCLTPEAAHALDEAVSVAGRRGHSQTTSLHAVSALLSLPSSFLRDACARARNSAYSPRLQFKALELCLSVSLDRVPSSQLNDEPPPVSNSLMAAIKRSQANQRRQPENFHLYHQLSQQQSSSCVKVELQNLILSILDDPVISRVFGEAGFRSSEIKLAIVRPLPQVLKFSRFKSPPMFLCNLGDDLDPGLYPGRRGFSFPFSSYSGYFNGDENCRRIGEVLMRNKGRNPLLVGVCAYDTLASFTETVNERKGNILPGELSGLNVISIESDIVTFTSESLDKVRVDMKIEELGQSAKQGLVRGLVVNFGDLKAFLNDQNHHDNSDAISYVVDKLTGLLQLQGGKVWFMGAAATYETYLKFVGRFPSVEKDWDLQLLPITSLKNTSDSQSFPKSSLMESFVPFGGFFSTPDLNASLSSYQCISRCHLCNEKCQQEIHDVTKGGFATSVADQYQSSLPPWLQMAELGTNKGFDVKTKDDGVVLSTKVAGLHKKWDSICQRLRHTQQPESNINFSRFPTVVGFQLVEDKLDDSKNHISKPNDPQNGNASAISDDKTQSTLSKQLEKPSEEEDLESGCLRSPCSFSNSSTGDVGQASPTSATSVTTDLNLRIFSVPSSDQNLKKFQQRISSPLFVNGDTINGRISSPDSREQFDISNLKMLYRALTERVGWQDEAIRVISQTIFRCRTRNRKCQGKSLRGDIWFSFIGPDWFGKRKIASAIAEIIYGSRDNFISADLSPPDGMGLVCKPFNHCIVNGYDVAFRGKTMVDYVAAELSKKPLSVVFLDNVDKADVQTQNSLSHAIQTGKILDSYGREVGINNAIFVSASTIIEDKIPSSRKDSCTYSEERILRAKCWPMQMLIEEDGQDKMGQNLTLSFKSEGISGSLTVNKRKLVGMNLNIEQQETSEFVKRAHKATMRNLDLNLPADENDEAGIDDENLENDATSDNSRAWLQDFFNQVDGKVVFRPFDFDALADRVSKAVNDSFQKIVGSQCSLEIDSKVMEQLLAAAYLSDQKRVVEDWADQVLSQGFAEILKRYDLRAHSIVKLFACEGGFPEEQMPGVYLPPRILLSSDVLKTKRQVL